MKKHIHSTSQTLKYFDVLYIYIYICKNKTGFPRNPIYFIHLKIYSKKGSIGHRKFPPKVSMIQRKGIGFFCKGNPIYK